MGYFRFRKVVSLGKFFKINISKTGVSASVGRPGATVNIKKDRVDGTVGLPAWVWSWLVTELVGELVGCVVCL